ncbi:MAG: nicotinate (nicotinamide) nucleotide adenylyltransferase [Bacteroidales bacterium]|nr:nicotinate (nicotinamide) nucleotide adenylyltransferase [Bacteroidales bacterium]MBQ9186180.1 nicotinate (nicotinamide) nucleotide adenylyltransferase [Bacteroidales bacterium]
MKTAVYSGSFNPLHIGHLAIMQYMTDIAGFDRVMLIVSPQNPFKDASANETGAARYKAACEAVARHPELKGVEVSDIELTMAPPHYTIRTLDTLRAMFPEDDFTIVVGADNLESFPRWKDYSRILTEYGIAVYPRKGFHRGHLKARLLKESPSYRISLLNAPMVTISSTEIREGLASGKDMSLYLM